MPTSKVAGDNEIKQHRKLILGGPNATAWKENLRATAGLKVVAEGRGYEVTPA